MNTQNVVEYLFELALKQDIDTRETLAEMDKVFNQALATARAEALGDEPKLHTDMDTPRRYYYSQEQLDKAMAEALREFWTELHAEAEVQFDRRKELLGPIETADDAAFRKMLRDGWSAWMLAKKIVENRHDAILADK